MAILATGNSFSAGDQVTAATLNAAVNSATFVTGGSGTTDNSTLTISSGQIIIKDGGVTGAKLSTGGPTWTTGGILQPGDITLTNANPEILGGDTDGVMYIAPSTTNALGGNILLYGDTHATKAKDVEIRATAGVELHYDDSASTWDFQANTITTTGALTTTGAFTSLGIDDNATAARLQVADTVTQFGDTVSASTYTLGANVDDGVVIYAGGTSAANGANLRCYGSSHATLADDFELRAGTTVAIYYDDSASSVDFQANKILTTGNVGIGETVPESLLHIKGGEGSALPSLSASTYLIVEGTDGDAELSIIADATAGNSILNLGSEADEDTGEIKHDHSTGTMSLSSDGNTGLQISNAGDVTFPGDQIAISTTQTPASENATGVAGTICWDASYLYICRATNTWSRITHNWGA